MKLWGGRFRKEAGSKVEEFTSSISFDRRLYRQDILGSIAHAKMLARCGIIPGEEAALIVSGLEGILNDIDAGKVEFSSRYEDIHMNVEKLLTDRVGLVGGKLHTARSRNDQVSLDMHMFMKEEIREVFRLISSLQEVLVTLAENNLGVIIPGYTHLQRAQPVLFSHHMMAYFFMLERDYGRFSDCMKRTDLMPLGAAALAGTSFPIDRRFVARELGFPGVYPNSMDAVSDRDFLLEFGSCASMCMMHLSRLSEELILWSSAEFGLVEMDDACATGSSIMPQKKNPDVAELIRGKTGRVYGNLMALLVVMKGLPLAYHSDMQEDKESTFDTVDTLKSSLSMTAGILGSMRINAARASDMARRDFSTATDAADYLARKGLPFRQAHEVVGKLVLYCIDQGKFLGDLSLEEFRRFSALFDEDVLRVLSPEGCVDARRSEGGTAPGRVKDQIALARDILKARCREEPGGKRG